MLTRTGFRAVSYICPRCQIMSAGRTGIFQYPVRRQFHVSSSSRGLLSLLTGDTFQARLHKEIGKMLEDYDQALIRSYTQAVEAVNSPEGYEIILVQKGIHVRRSSRFDIRFSLYRKATNHQQTNGDVHQYQRSAKTNSATSDLP